MIINSSLWLEVYEIAAVKYDIGNDTMTLKYELIFHLCHFYECVICWQFIGFWLLIFF